MKRTLLFTALSAALLLSATSKAQVPVVNKVLPKVTVGLKVGADFQSLSGASWDNAMKGGFTGGAFVGVSKGKIGVQGEVLVSSINYSSKTSGAPSVNTLYLNIPVLFEYKLISRLWIQAGPQFNSLLSAKQSSTDVKKYFNTSDISAAVGLQAILPLHIIAGARYVLGFTDVKSSNASTIGVPANESWKVNTVQIYVGFRFL